MDREVFEFLIRAKRATYAGRGAETAPSREKSHDLTYREGDLMYYTWGAESLRVRRRSGERTGRSGGRRGL